MTDIPTQLNQIAADLDQIVVGLNDLASDVTGSAAGIRTAAIAWDPTGQIAQLETDLAEAQATIADLHAQVAALQVTVGEVTGQRDDALAEVDNLQAEVAALEAQVTDLQMDLADCQGGGSDPTPMVSGPVGMPVGQVAPPGDYYGPSIAGYFVDAAGGPLPEGNGVLQTRSRGTAELVAVTPTRLRVVSDEAHAQGGATAEWRQYIFCERTQTVTWEHTRRVVTPVSDGFRTFKGPGMGHYVWGNAAEFPAGGQTSNRFALLRCCGWNWDYPDVPDDDRLSLVWRTGSQHAGEVTGWQVDAGGTQVAARIVPTGYTDGYTATSMIDRWGYVPVGVDVTMRLVMHWGTPGVSNGWVDLYTRYDGGLWEWTQHLEGFRWVDQAMGDGAGEGFSMLLPDFFYGGPEGDPTYVPDNPERAGVHELEGFKLWSGEVRPI